MGMYTGVPRALKGTGQVGRNRVFHGAMDETESERTARLVRHFEETVGWLREAERRGDRASAKRALKQQKEIIAECGGPKPFCAALALQATRVFTAPPCQSATEAALIVAAAANDFAEEFQAELERTEDLFADTEPLCPFCGEVYSECGCDPFLFEFAEEEAEASAFSMPHVLTPEQAAYLASGRYYAESC